MVLMAKEYISFMTSVMTNPINTNMPWWSLPEATSCP
jgi:hypothetical protein